MTNIAFIAISVIIIIIAIFLTVKLRMFLTMRQIKRKYNATESTFILDALRILFEFENQCTKSIGPVSKNPIIATVGHNITKHIASKQFMRDIVYYYRTSINHDIDMKDIIYGLIISVLMEHGPSTNDKIQTMLEIAFEMGPKPARNKRRRK
ncbi:hypothetical protein HDR66_03525 [bacterium]|nr:hypothetical protein [bacterium]